MLHVKIEMDRVSDDELVSSEGRNWYDNDTQGSDTEIVVYKYFYERQILASMFIVAAIVGTVGNGSVIVAVAQTKKLRSTTNAFVVNLAVADVLTCLFMPWQAVAVLGRNGWPLPGARWLCTLAAFIVLVTIGSSVNNLALIAMNRWVGITMSRATTSRIYTTRKVTLMLIVSWAIPLCCALAPVLTDFGELGYEKLYRTCSWVRSNPYIAHYNALIAVVYYPIQLMLILFSYSSIFWYVRKTSRRLSAVDAPDVSTNLNTGGGNQQMRRRLLKRQLDVTKNLSYIVLAFLLCLTPYFVSLVVYSDWSFRLVPWGGAILSWNSCVNPVIYATSHPDFKEAFRRMIRRPGDHDGASRTQQNKSSATTSFEVVNAINTSQQDS